MTQINVVTSPLLYTHTHKHMRAHAHTHSLSVTPRAVELLQVCVTAVWQCVPYLCVSFSRSISDCKLPERRNWAYKSLYKALSA